MARARLGSMVEELVPPVAPRRPAVLQAHGDERTDEWFWLRERDNPEVRDYLEAENAYTEAATRTARATARGRSSRRSGAGCRETDASAPVRRGPYEYFRRTLEGRQYGLYCRRSAGTPGLPDPDAEPGTGDDERRDPRREPARRGARVLRARRVRAQPRPRARSRTPSTRPAGSATSCGSASLDDRRGPARRPSPTSTTAWPGRTMAGPSSTRSPTTRCARSRSGATRSVRPSADDALVLQEDDERFYVGVYRTRTGRYVVIDVGSKITSEVWLVDAADPTRRRRSSTPREQGVEYSVEHHATEDGASRLFVAHQRRRRRELQAHGRAGREPGTRGWTEVVAPPGRRPPRGCRRVRGPPRAVRADGRTRADRRPRPRRRAGCTSSRCPTPCTRPGSARTRSSTITTLRFDYTSLVTPVSTYDYDLVERAAPRS